MGYYNVVKPCVVGKLHYVRPTTAPIEVDDEVAAPLVESGDLAPYGAIELMEVPGLVEVSHDSGATWEPEGVTGEPEVEKPEPRPRGRRKAAED